MKLLKFYTQTCCQCKQLTKVLKDFDLIPIENIDCDEDTNDLASKYSIRNLPTMILLDDEGKQINKFTGIITKETLINEINKVK